MPFRRIQKLQKTINLRPEVVQRLRIFMAVEDIRLPISELVEKALVQYLDRQDMRGSRQDDLQKPAPE